MKNNYWAKRSAETAQRLTDVGAAAANKQLAKYYSSCQKKVIREFEILYDELLAKSAGEQPTPADLYKLEKYWVMQGELTEELNKLGNKTAALLSKKFVEHYINVYESLNLALKSTESTFTTVDAGTAAQMVNAVWCADGKNWSQRVWNNTARLQQALNDELSHCIITGQKTTELKKLLQTEFAVSHNEADRLVRTEMSHIQNEAAAQRYKDYGIKEFEVLSDGGCEQCAHSKNKRYRIEEKIPVPFHPNCRCCIVPIVAVDD